MSTQNQINLKEKSTLELKALAFDLQEVTTQYTQMLQVVKSELQNRLQEEVAKQAEAPSPTLKAVPPSEPATGEVQEG